MRVFLSAVVVAVFAGGSCPDTPNKPGETPTPTPTPTPAVVTSILPTSGPASGGTAVTISGSNFLSGASVTVGGVPLTGVTVSSGSITGTTGASSTAGPVNVIVTNPNAPAGSLANGFTYSTVLVARISGASASVQHNTPVTFSGLTSTTTSPYTINQFTWNCGQDVSVYGTGCDVSNNATPTFNFRKCGGAGRQPCTTGTQRTYTVTLTVTDTSGNKSSTTFQVTVTNQYG